MILGVGLHEILWLVLALLIGGMISGVLAGLFGVSGGSVIVPVLYEGFRVSACPKTCACSSALGPRSPSSCRPPFVPISLIARRAWSFRA
jgi:hypothetical protein